ncbi:MAG: DUF2764 family protein [Desulfobacterales bacterium]|nr:DUF2764 family protein [Desulfobacterales bacterium]MBF0395275.1 DUF2764 family protein [Desulfobacterales bacterium]
MPITIHEVLKNIDQEKAKDLIPLVNLFEIEETLNKNILNKIIGNSSETIEVPQLIVEAFNKDIKEVGEDKWLTCIWEAFFDFASGVGKVIGSPLLSKWISWEKSLRYQIAEVRSSKTYEQNYEWDHKSLLGEWRAINDPLAGEKILDEERIKFIDEESKRYSFTIDEIVAYLLKVNLLSRYVKLKKEEGIKILKEVTKL